jgi:hypothetical protein
MAGLNQKHVRKYTIKTQQKYKSQKYLRSISLTLSLVDDSNDKAVNTENTSHDTGDQRLEDKVVSEDTDGADTDTGLGSSVRGTEVGEHEGRGETHVPEEGVLVDSF